MVMEIKTVNKDGSRFYKTPDGDYPSVTSILKIKNKPALVQWAANCCVEACIKDIENHLNKFKDEKVTIEEIKERKTAMITIKNAFVNGITSTCKGVGPTVSTIAKLSPVTIKSKPNTPVTPKPGTAKISISNNTIPTIKMIISQCVASPSR